MWFRGLALTHKSIVEASFSSMLAVEPEVQQLYLIWWGMYTTMSLLILALCARYTIEDSVRHYSKIEKKRSCTSERTIYKLYEALTVWYGLFTLTSLAGLLCIYYFPVDTQPHSHYLAASFAFGAAILSCICLLFRRYILYYKLEQKNGSKWVILVNVLCILIDIIMGILFVTNYIGIFEFILSLFLVLDKPYQVYDFVVDKDPIGHYVLIVKNERKKKSYTNSP